MEIFVEKGTKNIFLQQLYIEQLPKCGK